MAYEASEKALYNQLLYFRGLWDVENMLSEKGRPKLGKLSSGDGTETEEKVKAVAEWNRERFGTCREVVEGYLKRCGRVWVQMDALFGFAMGR